MEEFTTFQVSRILGVTRSSLQQWIDFKFIEPSISVAEGRGTKNLFSREDLYRIEMFRALSRSGIAQKKAGKLRGKFNFDLAAKNPQKFRVAFFSYNPDEKGELQMNMGYKRLGAKVKGKTPFYICILIDLLQIKEGVDQRIENWRAESA
jgi:DNA-binding transcriptional MerR regulator